MSGFPGPGPVFEFNKKVIITHAVFACIAVIGTAPAAILLGRYWHHNPRWFTYHRILNFVTILFVSIAFGLGTAATGNLFTGGRRDLHHDLGLSMFVLVLFQGFLGMGAHAVKPSSSVLGPPIMGKAIPRFMHIIFGIAIMILFYVEIWTGFNEWNRKAIGTLTPDAVRYLFVVIAALEVAVYLFPVGRLVLSKALIARQQSKS